MSESIIPALFTQCSGRLCTYSVDDQVSCRIQGCLLVEVLHVVPRVDTHVPEEGDSRGTLGATAARIPACRASDECARIVISRQISRVARVSVNSLRGVHVVPCAE